jgi:hypothetical protein
VKSQKANEIILKHTFGSITVIVNKNSVNRETVYTFQLGVWKTATDGSVFFSQNIPTESTMPDTLSVLILAAADAVRDDRAKDAQEEHERALALAAKPGAHIQKKGERMPRSTGKTARKKARLAGRSTET